jgi:hypothetical protein
MVIHQDRVTVLRPAHLAPDGLAPDGLAPDSLAGAVTARGSP